MTVRRGWTAVSRTPAAALMLYTVIALLALTAVDAGCSWIGNPGDDWSDPVWSSCQTVPPGREAVELSGGPIMFGQAVNAVTNYTLTGPTVFTVEQGRLLGSSTAGLNLTVYDLTVGGSGSGALLQFGTYLYMPPLFSASHQGMRLVYML